MGGVRRSPAGPDGRKCQKKVTQNQDGQWFCESCGKAFPAPAYRYMLNLEVVDYTESRYVSMFNDEAERLLGSAHIGEVQASVWDEATRTACAKAGIPLL